MEQKSNLKVRVIIGLGNPSLEYKYTYHNVGRLLVNSLISDSFITPSRKKFEYCKQGEIIFVQLHTFMNNSGQAVKEMLSYFKIKPENLLIAHDDSDMILGDYKIVFDQRSAGHKGVQSVIDTLKTQKIWRLKIGVRSAQEKVRQKADKFVLKKISENDLGILEGVFNKVSSKIIK